MMPIAIVNGKKYFAGGVVEQHGALIVLKSPKHGEWQLGQCAQKNSDAIRNWLREHLESALGCELPDVPGPWRYFLCDDMPCPQYGGGRQLWRARNGYGKADRFEHRWVGAQSFQWMPGSDNGLSIWLAASREPHCHEITEAEAIQFIGRAVCGLEVEASEETDAEKVMFWGPSILYRKHDGRIEYWDKQDGWRFSAVSHFPNGATPATRSSIIERYGEGPLK